MEIEFAIAFEAIRQDQRAGLLTDRQAELASERLSEAYDTYLDWETLD